jgi:hypothetical protein
LDYIELLTKTTIIANPAKNITCRKSDRMPSSFEGTLYIF